MEKLKRNLIFYIVLILDFYVIPYLIMDTGSGMFVMLVIVPVVCFITSIMYGIKNGFQVLYVLSVAILFIPSVFIFYNPTAWIYSVAYGIVALLGILIALPIRKKKI